MDLHGLIQQEDSSEVLLMWGWVGSGQGFAERTCPVNYYENPPKLQGRQFLHYLHENLYGLQVITKINILPSMKERKVAYDGLVHIQNQAQKPHGPAVRLNPRNSCAFFFVWVTSHFCFAESTLNKGAVNPCLKCDSHVSFSLQAWIFSSIWEPAPKAMLILHYLEIIITVNFQVNRFLYEDL